LPCLNASPPASLYTLSLHDALPIWTDPAGLCRSRAGVAQCVREPVGDPVQSPSAGDSDIGLDYRLLGPELQSAGVGCTQRAAARSEEHTSELQSRENLVCRLLLEKK